ncbi:MAG: NFACT RNA binding domain-containing protein, partial [Oscillospiraceae bacterium]|nr:NFACT RNA binding domain-containing protein [Oscillospiraceae bacterium]
KKTAQAHLTGLIEENRQEAEYLASIAAELERAQSQADLDSIRDELAQAGYLRQQRTNPRKKQKPAQPMSFRTGSGFEILVGRNNLQNDELTLRTARRTDLWLHVQKLHGSHVILRCEGARPDEETIYQAACLAAFYSEGAQAGRVPVDVTEARFVKKPHGARPGMVIYTNQRTIMAEPKREI